MPGPGPFLLFEIGDGAAVVTTTDVSGGFMRSIELARDLYRPQRERKQWREVETVVSSGFDLVVQVRLQVGGHAKVGQDEEDAMMLLGILE